MKFGDSLKTTGPAGRGANTTSHPLVLCLLLAIITLMVYWPARLFDFSGCDDPGYYAANAHVLAGFSWSGVGWAFTSGDMANWHPLTWLSHMLDAEFFGANPSGPHLVNVLFHIANTILLFLFLRRFTGAPWRSALAAGLFAVHPLHVESVAWIAERKDLLCGFFLLWTLLAYGRFAESRAAGKPGSGVFYGLALLAFTLALLSKPMAVTLPFLLLLLDLWPLNRPPLSSPRVPAQLSLIPLLVEKIPFFLLSGAASIVTFRVQNHGQAVTSLAAFPVSARLDNAAVAYARYLAKVLWPADLAMPYPLPAHWPALTVALSVLLLLGVSWLACALIRKWPLVFTGWFWFAGMLLPVIGLVQVGRQSMADRYVYLPLVGLLVIFVWGCARLIARWRISTAIAAVAALALLAACALKSRSQLACWQNDGVLFAHTLAVTGPNYTACMNLGAWLSKNGRPQDALLQYRAALQLNPADATALFNLGNVLFRLGQLDDAVVAYRQALQSEPQRAEVLDNYGLLLMTQQNLPAAITNFEAALKLRPDSAEAHNELASARFKQGRYEDAASEFYLAVKLSPDSSVFWANLGDALVRLGKIPKAVDCYQRALQLEPGNPKTIARLKSLGAQPAP